MTCKDCIHCEACEGTPRFYDDEYIKDVTFSGDVRDLCPTFKNKADFVEVVRCEKCKYRITHTCAITGTKTLFCDYGEKPVVVEPTHYCGYGERKVQE